MLKTNNRGISKMGKLRDNEAGFSVIETVLVLIIIGILGFVGWYVWHAKQTTDKVNSDTAKAAVSTSLNNEASAQTPQAFVQTVLTSVNSGNETQLVQYLSPSFKTFRQTSLTTPPCNKATNSNLGPDTKVLALFCGSLLDPSKLTPRTPTVTDFTFKDGQKGKSVDYQIAQTTGDTGTTYFTFKLLANDKTWQLNDYSDVFVGTGSTIPSPLLGERELTL